MPTINLPKKKLNEENGTKRAERIKMYATTRWKKCRLLYLSEHSLCEECINHIDENTNLKEPIIKPAENIHHIISFMSTDDPVLRYFLMYDIDNLQALCYQCHQLKHNHFNN